MSKKSLSRENILHVAKLANFTLSDAEIEKFRSQLSEVVEYISQLNEVDVAKVKITSQVTNLVNNNFTDGEKDERILTSEEALKNTKSLKDFYFKVQAIFKDQ